MNAAEVQDLDRCVVCRKPVRRGVEVARSDGLLGVACKACLRLSRRLVTECPK